MKKKTSKLQDNRTLLTYHDCVASVPEYFTYINDNNEEVKLTDKSYVIRKISSTKYSAEKTYVKRVPLEYIESKDSVKYEPEYFTYNNGTEIFLDVPSYNEELNTYIGTLEIVDVMDKKIKLYKE